MKRVLHIFSPSPAQVQALWRWSLLLFLLPLVLFVAIVMAKPQPQPQVTRLLAAELWLEPLGNVVFTSEYLEPMVQKAADFSAARWERVDLPNSIEMGASIDLPADAPKTRAWFRVQVPAALQDSTKTHGRLGLMGNRIIGGPWAVWADGQLVQANLADWRIQWNTPMRVMLPLNVREVMVAVPFANVQGYGMGSLFIGPADAIDLAWSQRNFWQADVPRSASIIALVLAFMSLHLAYARRNEGVYALLSLNALIWAISNLQYFYDFTGQDTLSVWFGAAMDMSITWILMLNTFFAFEYERLKAPRWRSVLIVYLCLSTLVTLPVWDWHKNALVLQHLVGAAFYAISVVLLAHHVFRRPTREGVALLVALFIPLPLGLHSLLNITNQLHPDQVHTFPMGVVIQFFVFMYVTSRRTVHALNTAEQHHETLEQQLAEQKNRLAAQHILLQRLEIEKQLANQREDLMQDLHDGLGSNLTSALLQARSGQLTPQATLMLLQDLTDELRNLGRAAATEQRSLNEILAELRTRVQRRLNHGGIQLAWSVAPDLPNLKHHGNAVGQHLRAMLGEAIANIIKHADATCIEVRAALRAGQVEIEIVDNGRGFNPAHVSSGRGLPGMHQRAMAIHATLHISPVPGAGTTWRLTAPAE